MDRGAGHRSRRFSLFEDNAFRYVRVVRGWENRTGWHYAFGGDEDVVEAAYDRLIKVLRASGREKTQEDGLDMEPLEVLRDIVREGEFPDVGGPPQVAKVYRHLNTQFFGIPWNGTLTVAGRPMLDYEQAFVPILDPDDPERQPRTPAGFGDVDLGQADELSEQELEDAEDHEQSEDKPTP